MNLHIGKAVSVALVLTVASATPATARHSAGDLQSSQSVSAAAAARSTSAQEGRHQDVTGSALRDPDVAGGGAFLEVALACMKQIGAVAPDVTSQEVLGEVRAGKKDLPPTGTSISVIKGCGITAMGKLSDVLNTSDTEAEADRKLARLEAAALAGSGDFSPDQDAKYPPRLPKSAADE